jgi:ferric-dicitrate binding protein FerR (iron transport regulator)
MKEFFNIKETDVFIRYFARETSAEEDDMVLSWLKASPENMSYFNQLKLLWEDTDDNNGLNQKFDTFVSLDKFKDEMNRPRSKSFHLFRWSSIAASIAFLIGMTIFFFYNNRDKEITIVSNKKTVKVTLPDASTVWLNRNSQLTYYKSYHKKRILKFSGEGYFEVQPNPSNPFEITTRTAKITVLGTKFNVNALPDKSTTEVVVVSGKVLLSQQIKGSTKKNDIILSSGEKGIERNNTKIPQKMSVDDPNYLSWKTHEFIFNNTNIKDIVAIINNTYDDAHIELETDNTENCNLSGKFNCQSINDILDMLRIVLNIKVEKKGENIIIKSAGC